MQLIRQLASYGHAAGLRRMLELPMTTPSRHQEPAVLMQQPHDLADFQSSPILAVEPDDRARSSAAGLERYSDRDPISSIRYPFTGSRTNVSRLPPSRTEYGGRSGSIPRSANAASVAPRSSTTSAT